MSRLLWLALSIGWLSLAVHADAAEPAKSEAPDALSALSLTRLDGAPLPADALAGKVVLFVSVASYGWTAWCCCCSRSVSEWRCRRSTGAPPATTTLPLRQVEKILHKYVSGGDMVRWTAVLEAPERRTWATERLRLGQANVGTWVLVAALAIAAQPTLPADVHQGLLWMLVTAGFVLLQAPFDLVGGYVLPVRHGRRTPGAGRWALAWARGVLIHGLTMVGIGWVALLIGTQVGPWAAIGSLVLLGGALVAFQGTLARLLAGRGWEGPDQDTRRILAAAKLDPERVDVLATEDRGFVGGWVGPRGLERLVLPRRWTELDADTLAWVALRRRMALRSGARAQGVIGALAFNATGLVLSWLLVPGAGFEDAGALLLTAAGVTLWSFLGLLTLPTASRSAVLRLDRDAAGVCGARRAVKAIEHLDRDQEDERARDPWVETIFHPVPAPAHRVGALSASKVPPAPVVPWRIARMALFTSQASLSWLSRAVHCNVGRPELWALYPGD